jgi:hypothetical protein
VRVNAGERREDTDQGLTRFFPPPLSTHLSFPPPDPGLFFFPRRLCPADAAAAQLLPLISVHSRPLAGDPSSLRLCASVSLRSLS